MKKLVVVLIVAFVGFESSAQSDKHTNYPYWTISKLVDQIQFKKTAFEPVKVLAGNPIDHVSKDIARLNVKDQSIKNINIRLDSFSLSPISKSSARQHL